MALVDSDYLDKMGIAGRRAAIEAQKAPTYADSDPRAIALQ